MGKTRSGPSDHIKWSELACKDGEPYPQKFVSDGRIFKLALAFEIIREMYGKPITILSAYRSPAHNKKVGGAKNSQHLHGRALDLKPPKGVTVDKFYQDIKLLAKDIGIRGLGKYKTFVHIDIRPTDNIAYWSGNGVKDSGSSRS